MTRTRDDIIPESRRDPTVTAFTDVYTWRKLRSHEIFRAVLVVIAYGLICAVTWTMLILFVLWMLP